MSRAYGYVRDAISSVWISGVGKEQEGYSREIAGAMLLEADEFFDRALMLFLLRLRLRELQASTWSGVAAYYSNYFAATSFIRLHMKSVTHLPMGDSYDISRVHGATPIFRVRQRSSRLGHTEVWKQYYDLTNQMGWPDPVTVNELAPAAATLRFREQMYRERINYRPGEGFEEIYQSRSRYLRTLKEALRDDGQQPLALSDSAYTDRMAARRLGHIAKLLRRLSALRADRDFENRCWLRRSTLIEKYTRGSAEKREANSLVG